MAINLGDKAKDTISGFSGVVTGHYTYLNGCVRLQLEPDYLNKDGNPIDSRIFDIEQVELVKAAKPRSVYPTGGPRPDPSPRSTPRR
jgi:hypothetical protein